MRHTKIIISYSLIFLLGALAGFVIKSSFFSEPDAALDYESIRDNDFKYTHPLLDVMLGRDAPQNIGLRPFKRHIEKRIHEDMDRKWADTIAVYFRDLNNGPWFNVGETKLFYPASLLKVPLLMAILKQAEAAPGLLRRKIRYDDPYLKNTQNVPSNNLEFGKYYTIDALLDGMITRSDNVATLLLLKFADKNILLRTYIHLGIIDANSGPERASLLDNSLAEFKFTIPHYASFFRVLYNGSYLSREMSEKALGLLARTDFRSGIIAGLPSTIEVAHKWGYRDLGDRKQLHDCGIIYYPKHPYLLCVMTSGDSVAYLDDAIKEISRTVYEEVDHQMKQAH